MMRTNAGSERRDGLARLTAAAAGLLLLLALPCTAAAESGDPGTKPVGQRTLDEPPTLQPANAELQTLLQQLHQAAQYCDQETYDEADARLRDAPERPVRGRSANRLPATKARFSATGPARRYHRAISTTG